MTSTWRISASVLITSVAEPSLDGALPILACRAHRGARTLILARYRTIADEGQTSSKQPWVSASGTRDRGVRPHEITLVTNLKTAKTPRSDGSAVTSRVLPQF